MLKERAVIVVFFAESPHLPSIWIPLVTMEPNIMIVHPPKTASGNVARTAPNTGKMPAITRTAAPVAIAILFTTPVMATRPTFWLNDVIGEHPKSPPKALMNPSQAIEPEASFAVMSR